MSRELWLPDSSLQELLEINYIERMKESDGKSDLLGKTRNILENYHAAIKRRELQQLLTDLKNYFIINKKA